MSNTGNGRRRWLQFHLRSVVLLTAGIGVWLGYEVSGTSHQQRQVVALSKLDGAVQFEPSGLSLLRHVGLEGFGLSVERAEILGQTVEDAIPHLRELPGLREVRVVYDGTCDLYPLLDRLQHCLPRTSIVPTHQAKLVQQLKTLDDERWREHVRKRRHRLVQKMKPGQFTAEAVSILQYPVCYFGPEYHVVSLPGGDVAEVQIWHDAVEAVSIPGTSESLVVLLVRDEIVDWKVYVTNNRVEHHRLVLEDIDADGRVDVGVEWWPGMWNARNYTGRNLAGDKRSWIDVFRIHAGGLESQFTTHDER